MEEWLQTAPPSVPNRPRLKPYYLLVVAQHIVHRMESPGHIPSRFYISSSIFAFQVFALLVAVSGVVTCQTLADVRGTEGGHLV